MNRNGEKNKLFSHAFAKKNKKKTKQTDFKSLPGLPGWITVIWLRGVEDTDPNLGQSEPKNPLTGPGVSKTFIAAITSNVRVSSLLLACFLNQMNHSIIKQQCLTFISSVEIPELLAQSFRCYWHNVMRKSVCVAVSGLLEEVKVVSSCLLQHSQQGKELQQLVLHLAQLCHRLW